MLESNSASTENANRLHAGEIEFGFMASNWIGRAKNGEPPFTRPLDLAMAAPMNAGPLFFIVRRDSADPLVHRSARPADRGRAPHKRHGAARAVHFGALGMSFSDFSPVYLDFAAGAQALAAGEVDAQFQCPIPNEVMTELAGRRCLARARLRAGELEAVLKAVPYYRRMLMRKGAIRGLEADCRRWRWSTCW